MTRKTWVQDPTTGKLVPKDEYARRPTNTSATVLGDIEPFISPITRRPVNSRSSLRQHNLEHGVTDSRDYSSDFMLDRTAKRARAAQGQTSESRQDRINLIRKEIDKHDR